MGGVPGHTGLFVCCHKESYFMTIYVVRVCWSYRVIIYVVVVVLHMVIQGYLAHDWSSTSGRS